MAIAASTLQTTISERVTLNGVTYGNTITKTFTGVKEVRQSVITVPTSEKLLYTTLGTLATDGSAAAELDHDLIKYARIKNCDTTNSINLLLESEAGDEFMYKVNAGTSFLLSNHADCMEATTAGADVTIGTYASSTAIKNVSASANTASVDIELFIAIGT